MPETGQSAYIIAPDDLILITGATGFIGSRLVRMLLDRGFRNLRCFTRASGEAARVESLLAGIGHEARVEVFRGNLLSPEDCAATAKDAVVVLHLAAGRGEKSYPEAFMNSVVTTRNLLDAVVRNGCLKRFVNVSSFSVYSNRHKPEGRLLTEMCPVEAHPEQRGEAYCFAKVKQDEIVAEYASKYGLPHVTVRPGYVLGPGKKNITGRVGIDTFGIFMHLGGSNKIPFTYVDNCAEAIALAGLTPGINGEIFNVVDDDLPSSRHFLRLYKRKVKRFRSIYVPHCISYALCYLWERYSNWSAGQLPPVFNRKEWHSYWKKTLYSNAKLKARVGWRPRVSMAEGLERYFAGCLDGEAHA
jgi:nucleoside-diphosphate-sugar epimerase